MNDKILERLARVRVFGRSPVNAYLRLNKWIWRRLPAGLLESGPMRSYGLFLSRLVRMRVTRRQFFGTFFMRNRPELELMCRLVARREKYSELKISVLGCSNGSEVYSILWSMRSKRPDLKLTASAVDISSEVLELARKGVYSLKSPELVGDPIFERLTDTEMREMFDRDGDRVWIKSWLQEGITWHCGDAGDPGMLGVLGLQDIVVANRFLCHMAPREAERCLRNIARLVKPGGHLFVSGVDLEVRTAVARHLGWEPVRELIEPMHDGDPTLRVDWPFEYWGLEPLDKSNPDWAVRYASAFVIGAAEDDTCLPKLNA